MSGISMERMTPEEIARLKLRYTNRDGSAEVLCSKAWAHISLQDGDITRLTARVKELETMVQKAYNDGFGEGIKEHTTHKGGTPWALSKWPAALTQPAQESPQ
jgi:hypothetical protein